MTARDGVVEVVLLFVVDEWWWWWWWWCLLLRLPLGEDDSRSACSRGLLAGWLLTANRLTDRLTDGLTD